jgi:hypothetical protein
MGSGQRNNICSRSGQVVGVSICFFRKDQEEANEGNDGARVLDITKDQSDKSDSHLQENGLYPKCTVPFIRR